MVKTGLKGIFGRESREKGAEKCHCIDFFPMSCSEEETAVCQGHDNLEEIGLTRIFDFLKACQRSYRIPSI